MTTWTFTIESVVQADTDMQFTVRFLADGQLAERRTIKLPLESVIDPSSEGLQALLQDSVKEVVSEIASAFESQQSVQPQVDIIVAAVESVINQEFTVEV